MHDYTFNAVRFISVRDEFRSRGLKSLARICCQFCTKIKWLCPNIIRFFCPKMAILKILGGCSPPPPPTGRTPAVNETSFVQGWAEMFIG